MAFNVGDSVQILSLDEVSEEVRSKIRSFGINGDMENLSGEIMTIERVYDEHGVCYLEEDPGGWVWPTMMLKAMPHLPDGFCIGGIVSSDKFEAGVVIGLDENDNKAICRSIIPTLKDNIIIDWNSLTKIVEETNCEFDSLIK